MIHSQEKKHSIEDIIIKSWHYELNDVLIKSDDIIKLCNKPWWVVAVCYTEVTFDTKLLLVPQNDVRYREVPAISVRYKEAFLWD